MTYEEFLASKRYIVPPCGFEPSRLPDQLFDFQRDIVRWSVRRGRAAIFADCGLGKTAMQLAWANQIARWKGGSVLILAPLSVAKQTVAEGQKFGIAVNLSVEQSNILPGINITNYEKLHKFTPDFKAIVLDESSILKAFDGKTKKALLNFSRDIPYRLACTATPAPNDYTELGNHFEFLGILTMAEMLATFFVHDGWSRQQDVDGRQEDLFSLTETSSSS